MTENGPSIISKGVKDMYGTFMGNVIGTATDIDGTIQTVGLDCGSEGLRQIPYEQLVLQGDVLIFIPNWRIEAQRLLREKGLTIRRLTALMGIVSDNSEMKQNNLSLFLIDMRPHLNKSIFIKPIRTMINHSTTEIFFENLDKKLFVFPGTILFS